MGMGLRQSHTELGARVGQVYGPYEEVYGQIHLEVLTSKLALLMCAESVSSR